METKILLYLVAGVLFILSLAGLSSAKTAVRGNRYGILGMLIAVVTTLAFSMHSWQSALLIYGTIAAGAIIGTAIAKRIDMTALPQLMAGFHSLVGLAAVCVAFAAFYSPTAFGIGTPGHINKFSLLEMSLGAFIGAMTFTGSFIAFMKLQGLMSAKPIRFAGQHLFNGALGVAIAVMTILFTFIQTGDVLTIITLCAAILGVLLILPIGGADMPVVVSMLNSYSGWAAAGIGFTLQNMLLIITGALVGASGAILSYIMCKAMNRSFFNVILGGLGEDEATNADGATEERAVKAGSAEDAAFLMEQAGSVIIVPGYGMAVAQAQHIIRELVDILKSKDVKVKFAIHPVAGRMPGHMNVLLAEANIPYEDVFELEDINSDFSSTDVALVIGANDVTNPAARTDTASPIYGMPILDVDKAKTILFVKRSMGVGYAGIQNELFFNPKTMMLFGDAKKVSEEIVKAFEMM